jgi:hypothetical protein
MKARIGDLEFEVFTENDLKLLASVMNKLSIPGLKKEEDEVPDPPESEPEHKHYKKRRAKIVVLEGLPKIKGKRKQKWWTKKERAFLDKARHTLPVNRIAKLLKRSQQSVRCQIWLLQHPERRQAK